MYSHNPLHASVVKHRRRRVTHPNTPPPPAKQRRSTSRRWPRIGPGGVIHRGGLFERLLVLSVLTVLLASLLPTAPVSGTDSPELEVSVEASATDPFAGEEVTFHAVIANLPAGEQPRYRWEMNLGDSWRAVGTDREFTWSTSVPETARFRVTVFYGGEWSEASTSDVLKVVVAGVEATEDVVPEGTNDYDTDDDQLIEISTAAQLNAIRWDPDGDGAPASANVSDYEEAFPEPISTMCDDPDTTGTTETCAGYELVADIDIGVAPYNSGEGWVPIDNWITTLDGDGHTISGLFISRPNTTDVGLFGRILQTAAAYGTVENLALTGVRVTGIDRVGALAGSNQGAIRRVYVGGEVNSKIERSGGLVGYNDYEGRPADTGVFQSYANVRLLQDTNATLARIGGLIGQNEATVVDSYAAGEVILNATGNVSGALGGLIGDDQQIARTTRGGHGVDNSYARGTLSVSSGSINNNGGLVGRLGANIPAASYWDTETTGRSNSAGGTGLTTLEMQAPTAPGAAAGDTYHGWDANKWDFGNAGQYPALNWLPVSVAAQRGETEGFVLSVDTATLTEASASTGATNVVVTATLAEGEEPEEAAVTVTLTLDGTATGAGDGADYMLSDTLPQITIGAGATSGNATVSITPVDDTAYEPDETIIVRGSAGTDVPSPAVITLTSADNPAITLSSTVTDIAENASTGVSVNVDAVLDVAVTSATTFNLAFSGRATEGTDYDVTGTASLTFASGATTATTTITVTPIDNNHYGDKTIIIGGTLTGYQVVTHTITLTDDDGIPITLSLSPTSVVEGAEATQVTVTATLDEGAVGTPTDITISDDGTGTATTGTDYAAISDVTLTIAEGSATGQVMLSFTPTDDNVDDDAETVVIAGAAPTGFVVSSATLTIADDGPSDTVNLTVTPTAIDEAGGAVEVTIKAELNAMVRNTATTVTLSYDSSGSAGVPSDGEYAGDAPGTLTIAANTKSATKDLTITPANDDVDEDDETIVIAGTTSAAAISTVNSATLTIRDDDTASTVINLSANPSSVGEADGSMAATITVTATLSGDKTRNSDTVVTLGSALTGTATLTSDYTSTYAALTTKTITIPAKMSSANLTTFTITPVDDSLNETAETITVTGSLMDFTVNPATINLVDNDTPSTSLTLTVDTDSGTMGNQTSLAEGASSTSVKITATLDGGTRSQTTTVTLSLSGGAIRGTDYDAPNTLADNSVDLTIAAGTTSKSASFNFNPTQDDIDEGTGETITVGATAQSGTAGNLVTISVTTADITINDDDTAPKTITLSVDDLSIGEGETSATAVKLTATLSGTKTYPDDTTFTVNVGGTATKGTDYTIDPSSFSVTIPATMQSGTVDFSITPIDDRLTEGGESIILQGQKTGFTSGLATINLTDDDTASNSLTLKVEPARIDEHDSGDNNGDVEVKVTAELDDGTLTSNTTVTLTLGGTATSPDYTVTSPLPTITIPAGQVEASETIKINPTDDVIDEGSGETITVSGTTGASGPSVASADITIADNDTASKFIDLTASPTSVREDAGVAVTITVTAKLQGTKVRPTATTVKLGSALSGSATAGTGNDYTRTYTQRDITIAAGQLSGTATGFNVTPMQDNDSEGPETIELAGTACVSSTSPCPTDEVLTVNKMSLRLVDDDLSAIELSLDTTSAMESADSTSVVVTARRATSGDTAPVTVNVVVGATGSTAERGSDKDYTGTATATITLSASQTSNTTTISIDPVDDRLVEGNEKVEIGGMVGDGSTHSVTPATFTITSEDITSDTINLSVNPTNLGEDANATTVTVTATVNNGAVEADTVLTLSAPNGTATTGTDYADPGALGTITLGVGAVSGMTAVSINPTQDDIDEGTGETIVFDVTSDNATITTVHSATLTIDDDDTASTIIDLTTSPTSVREDGSSVSVTVTATLRGTTTRGEDTTVTLGSSLGGTATPGMGNDYTHTYASLSKTLTILEGTSSITSSPFTITPDNDTDAEGTETIIVSATLAGFTVNEATFSLMDDEVSTPEPVGDLEAELSGRNGVRLSWTAAATPDGMPLTSYRLERRIVGEAWQDVSATISRTATSYADGGLAYTTDYDYRLYASNADGEGPVSNVASITTGARRPPGGSGPGGGTDELEDFARNTSIEITANDIAALGWRGFDGAAPVVSGSGGSVLVVQPPEDGSGVGRLVVYTRTGGLFRAEIEIELDPQNTSPQGVAWQGSTAWVTDGEANTLFAYDLESGVRLPSADIALNDRYGAPKAISAGPHRVFALRNPVVVNDRTSGNLIGEYSLDAATADPRGAWSDGTTIWVSDAAAGHLFAYRLPTPDTAAGAPLERVRGEEFDGLSEAGNDHAAGIWSNGAAMFVFDENDARIYAYNMPAAIDTRLTVLTLSGVDIGRFSPDVTTYEGTATAGLEHTTVAAVAARSAASVVIELRDSSSVRGHQVDIGDDGAEITVTVTSSDGSRSRTYQIQVTGPPQGYFVDDEGSVHEASINALAAAGITTGCATNPARYCPDEPVTRAQLATFLTRALKLPLFPEQPTGFTDINPGGTHTASINALAAAGITTGCATNPARYCPDEPVTRAQLATFLTRALKLPLFPEQPTGFTDINPGGTHTASINALAAAGITTGCATNPARYCPDEPVTRAQLATFLTRALKLPLFPEQPTGFTDINPGGTHTASINALAAAGITTGCATNPARYCPDEPVTRAQLATFLTRALKLPLFPEQPTGFTDINPGGTHTASINALAAAGITTGCATNPLQYCPDEPVTRAQLATFLTRALKLPLFPEQPTGFTDINPGGTHTASINALAAAGITTGCATNPLQYCPDEPVTRAQLATFLTRALKLPLFPDGGQ